MTVLVADVGGTNTRIALAGQDAVPRDISRFANDAFPSFYACLEEYLKAHAINDLQAASVAVAGPVTSRRARLTNRDWTFEPEEIARHLTGHSSLDVHLVNDLVALGQALPGLAPEQVEEIKPASVAGPSNGQSLVVGLGTGFNVCLAKDSAAGLSVIGAELGHASLPVSVHSVLGDIIGTAANRFETAEDLFSGRGVSRLHGALWGGQGDESHDIVAASSQGQARETVDIMMRLLGLFGRELVFQYLPLGGIYFAGGVARGVLSGPTKTAFLTAFQSAGPFADLVQQVPVHLITDDAAALTGVARMAVDQTYLPTA